MLQFCRIARDEPVAVLAGSPEETRFRYWPGASGARYLHTVHELACWPGCDVAVAVFARRLPGGSRDILWIGEIRDGRETAATAALLTRMAAAGADELHVHLLAEDAAGRAGVIEDLRAAAGFPA